MTDEELEKHRSVHYPHSAKVNGAMCAKPSGVHHDPMIQDNKNDDKTDDGDGVSMPLSEADLPMTA